MLHDAFHRAFEEAKPCNARIPGLQEFAAALWERRRLIPSNHDPLMHIFTEVRPVAAPASAGHVQEILVSSFNSTCCFDECHLLQMPLHSSTRTMTGCCQQQTLRQHCAVEA